MNNNVKTYPYDGDFWKNEDSKYTYNGELWTYIPEGHPFCENLQEPGELLYRLVDDVCMARGIPPIPYDVNIALSIGRSQGLTPLESKFHYQRFDLKPGQAVNVGVQKDTKNYTIPDPYICYKNVTPEVTWLMQECSRKIKFGSTLSPIGSFGFWILSVKPMGDWDFKHSKNFYPLFPTDFRTSSLHNKSKFFYFKGFGYKKLDLLRNDDVGNMVYGATGRHLTGIFSDVIAISPEMLIDMGGEVQKISDMGKNVPIELLKRYGHIKVIWEDMKKSLRLDYHWNYEDTLSKEIKNYIDKVNSKIVNGRNEIGDDPRDSYSIGRGYELTK